MRRSGSLELTPVNAFVNQRADRTIFGVLWLTDSNAEEEGFGRIKGLTSS